MAKVKFNLKDAKADDSLIMLIFRYNGKRLKYSTCQSVPVKFWNPSTQRIRRTSNFPQGTDINAYLDQLTSHTTSIFNRYRSNNTFPTTTQFKEELNQLIGKATKEDNKTLFSFIDSFIEEREQSDTFAKGTVKYYKTFKNILNSYCEAKRKKLDFNDIDLTFYRTFLDFLYSDRKYSINAAGKQIKVLKTILNDATEKGINTNLAFKSKSFKKPTQEVDNTFLTKNELTKLFYFDLTANEKLNKVRDLLSQNQIKFLQPLKIVCYLVLGEQEQLTTNSKPPLL